MCLLVVSEILGLILNKMTDNDKYYLAISGNKPEPV